jgi:hypothetical protein
MAVVIYSKENGVFLGECFGLGFWTNLDAAGQPSAVTFPSEADARDYMETWSTPAPADVKLVEVVPDDGPSGASAAACMRAGLPGWLVEDSPVENALPV